MNSILYSNAKSVLALIMVLLLLNGCNNQLSNGETVGQKVDKVIDKANAQVYQAHEKVGSTIQAANGAVKSTADKVQEKASQVGAIIEDSAITTSIKADLVKDPALSALRIDVNTVKGEVTLKGEADTESARDRAARIAMAAYGVTQVTNSISVKNK